MATGLDSHRYSSSSTATVLPAVSSRSDIYASTLNSRAFRRLLAAVSTPHPSTAAGERFACAPFSVCEAACLLAARRMAATGMMKEDGGGASPVSRSALKDGPPAGTGNGQQTDGTDAPAVRLLVEKTKVAGQLTLAVALSNSILRRDDV